MKVPKKPLKPLKELTPQELAERKRLERQNAQRTFKPNLKTIPWKK
ncbi:hypothetical protein SAMN05444156_1841 [Verrucomicrobium sp. GAS474]|nr:hypothetical protein [Verrucomicrobium sp. GAS474]SDU08001.1 hypothetical protein SAMN05444156_1841 [Verrucomicrobium sp. GAS474]